MSASTKESTRLVVIGASAGGIQALKKLLPLLGANFPFSILLVLHRLKNVASGLEEVIQNLHPAPVQELADKDPILPGCIYLAPANYHTLIEQDLSFSLSYDEPVNYSRPSIDVSFASASVQLKGRVCGILLTGANADGANGLAMIEALGGLVVVQNPEEAEVSRMPEAGRAACKNPKVLKLQEIALFLNQLANS